MATMFDVLGFPGKTPLDQDSNLSDHQKVLLHKARSLCQLLLELANPLADAPISHHISFDAIEGTAWLLRDLIDEAGKPKSKTKKEK